MGDSPYFSPDKNDKNLCKTNTMKQFAQLPIEISIPTDQIIAQIAESVKRELQPILSAIQPQKQPGQLLSRKQAAQKLGVSFVTLNSWTKQGLVKGYRIGARLRYKEQEIEAALIQIKTKQTKAA
jgi:hypothetical protein